MVILAQTARRITPGALVLLAGLSADSENFHLPQQLGCVSSDRQPSVGLVGTGGGIETHF